MRSNINITQIIGEAHLNEHSLGGYSTAVVKVQERVSSYPVFHSNDCQVGPPTLPDPPRTCANILQTDIFKFATPYYIAAIN